MFQAYYIIQVSGYYYYLSNLKVIKRDIVTMQVSSIVFTTYIIKYIQEAKTKSSNEYFTAMSEVLNYSTIPVSSVFTSINNMFWLHNVLNVHFGSSSKILKTKVKNPSFSVYAQNHSSSFSLIYILLYSSLSVKCLYIFLSYYILKMFCHQFPL